MALGFGLFILSELAILISWFALLALKVLVHFAIKKLCFSDEIDNDQVEQGPTSPPIIDPERNDYNQEKSQVQNIDKNP